MQFYIFQSNIKKDFLKSTINNDLLKYFKQMFILRYYNNVK